MQKNLIEVLITQSEMLNDEIAFTFISNGGKRQENISFAELHQRASDIAALLQQTTDTGSRALLLYPSGLDFISAFFGCLYSETIAVPAYPPNRPRAEKATVRVQRIIRDCGA